MILSLDTVCPSSFDELMCKKSKTTLSYSQLAVSPNSQARVHILNPENQGH